jgi:hypothetical protein
MAFKKSLLIKLHLYAGIFTSFYLLAFGFSALVMNHNVQLEKKAYTTQWETELSIDGSLNDDELAEQIRDELNIMGWLPRWEFERDSTEFAFNVVHFGRNYHIEANLSNGQILVAEAPKGFLAVFHGLHFLNGKIPNAPFLIRSWQVYQWLALFVMAISLVLGLWLWIRYNYQTWQGYVFGSLFIFTIVIMMLI